MKNQFKARRRKEFFLLPMLWIIFMVMVYNSLFLSLSAVGILFITIHIIVLYEIFSSETWHMLAGQSKMNILPTIFILVFLISFGIPVLFVGVLFLVLPQGKRYVVAYLTYVILVYLSGVKVLEKGKLPPKGQKFVGVINHGSVLDSGLLAMMSVNPWSTIADKKMFRIPPFSFFLKYGGGVPLEGDDEKSGIRAILGALKKMRKEEVNIIYIFAQGARQKGDWFNLGELKEGAFALAKHAKVPILPIIFYLPGLYAPVFSWKQWYLCPQPVTIVYGDLIDLESKKLSESVIYTKNVMEAMIIDNIPV